MYTEKKDKLKKEQERFDNRGKMQWKWENKQGTTVFASASKYSEKR